MDTQYDEDYFTRHYSTPLYRRYIAMRNVFIRGEVAKLVSSGRFLEVGFGDDNLIRLFDKDYDVFGVDISEFAVREVTKRYPPAHFKVCDISEEEVPFDEKFDVICAINTVEHLENPVFALQNAFDSLKKKGVLAVYLPTRSNVLSRVQYRLFYDVEEHVFRPSVRALRSLLRGVGFRVCTERAASFAPLKLSGDFLLQSFILYFGLWRK